MMDNTEHLEELIRQFTRVTVTSFKRRCAVRHGVRTPEEIVCNEHDIDPVRQWCKNCGKTRVEMVQERLSNG